MAASNSSLDQDDLTLRVTESVTLTIDTDSLLIAGITAPKHAPNDEIPR